MTTHKTFAGSSHKHPSGSERLHRVHPAERIELTLHVKRNGESFDNKRHSILAGELFDSGINVLRSDERRHDMTIEGSVDQFEKLFGIELHHYLSPDGTTFRSHEGELTVPRRWHDHVTAVLGLNNRKVAKPHFRYHREHAKRTIINEPGTFTPQQVAELYSFPPGNGAGQTISPAYL